MNSSEAKVLDIADYLEDRDSSEVTVKDSDAPKAQVIDITDIIDVRRKAELQLEYDMLVEKFYDKQACKTLYDSNAQLGLLFELEKLKLGSNRDYSLVVDLEQPGEFGVHNVALASEPFQYSKPLDFETVASNYDTFKDIFLELSEKHNENVSVFSAYLPRKDDVDNIVYRALHENDAVPCKVLNAVIPAV